MKTNDCSQGERQDEDVSLDLIPGSAVDLDHRIRVIRQHIALGTAWENRRLGIALDRLLDEQLGIAA